MLLVASWASELRHYHYLCTFHCKKKPSSATLWCLGGKIRERIAITGNSLSLSLFLRLLFWRTLCSPLYLFLLAWTCLFRFFAFAFLSRRKKFVLQILEMVVCGCLLVCVLNSFFFFTEIGYMEWDNGKQISTPKHWFSTLFLC